MVKGSHHTEASKAKMGHLHAEETKKRMRAISRARWKTGAYRRHVLRSRKAAGFTRRYILSGALEQYRQNQKLTTREIATLLGITPQHYRRLVAKYPCPIERVMYIGALTGISMNELVEGPIKRRGFGARWTEDRRKKLSIMVTRRWEDPAYVSKALASMRRASEKLRGENNRLWRGGDRAKSRPGFTPRLRLEIRSRDGFICMACGVLENGRAHHVHHIDGTKYNHAPSNLITLCPTCHTRATFSHEAWRDYFLSLFPRQSKLS